MCSHKPVRRLLPAALGAALVWLAGCSLPVADVPFDNYVGPPPGKPAAARAPETGPLKISVADAILLGMENNRGLKVDRFNPAIERTFEEQQRAVFDPALAASTSASHARSRTSNSTGADAGVSLSKFFPTGTDVTAGATTDYTRGYRGLRDTYVTRAGLTVTQALLQGAGLDVNLASLRQAQLDTRSSEFELRAFAELLLANIESTYWDYSLAKQQIKIYQDSLDLAQKQLEETQQRIKVGKLAETELAAAEAELALRREGLIDARSAMETARLRLLQLLNPPGAGLWQRELVLEDEPLVHDVKLDEVDSHVAVALRMRPDLNQARLGVQRDDLELVKTRNGLLPQLDFFITLGKTGYANSFAGSVEDVGGKRYDVSAGLSLAYTLGNRDARARNDRALLSRDQSVEAVRNFVQLVQVDVRSAYIEANRALEQVGATAATLKLEEEKVRAETEKFRVGKSTSLLVAQAQRDLLASQISEIQARANFLKALVQLYRLEGSLLERRGIQAPGRQPVDLRVAGE